MSEPQKETAPNDPTAEAPGGGAGPIPIDIKRVVGGLDGGAPILGYQNGNSEYWFELDAMQQWVPAKKTAADVKLLPVTSKDFIRAFISKVFADADTRMIGRAFPEPARLSDLLIKSANGALDDEHSRVLTARIEKEVCSLRTIPNAAADSWIMEGKIPPEAIIEALSEHEAAKATKNQKNTQTPPRLMGIVGDPLKFCCEMEYQREASSQSKHYTQWVAFEGDPKRWKTCGEPANIKDSCYVTDNEFVTAFIQQNFGNKTDEQIKKICPKPTVFADLLMPIRTEYAELSLQQVRVICNALESEKSQPANEGDLVKAGMIDADTILAVVHKYKADAQTQAQEDARRKQGDVGVREQQEQDRLEGLNELKEGEHDGGLKTIISHNEKMVDRQEKMAMDSTKVSLGTVVAIIGSLVGLSANRRVNQESDEGQPVSGKSRLFQVAAWGTALAGIVYAAMAIWKNKAPTPPR